jgi:hypothetical protein
MRNYILLKRNFITVIFFFFILQTSFSQNNNGTIDAMGDIAIIAVNKIPTPSTSDYAFVLLDDCLTGTKIFFDDDDWTGTAFSSLTGEGTNEWTNNTGKTLGAGTVIIVNSGNDNPTANLGDVIEQNSGFNLAEGDQLYAYLGSERSPTVFLSFWGETNTINASDSAVLTGTKLSGSTDLTNGTTARVTADLGFYNGSTDCNGTIDECAAMINGGTITSGSFTWASGVKTAFKGAILPNKFFGSTDTDWNTIGNWGYNSIPIATDHIRIPNVTNKPIISASTGAVANNITIDASSSLTINSGGTLIINGTATVNGSFNYKVNVSDTNWHLVSSPVVNEQFDDTWNDANGINTTGTGNNEAVASYINTSDADGDWVYYQNGGSTQTFSAAKGYSLQRTGAGDYTFIGTFPEPPINYVITANNEGNSNENRWNLVGNPYPAYINIATFLATNTTPITDTHESIYVWNPNAGTSGEYQDLQTGFIHPGQAFFVSSNVASTSVTLTKAMQIDQNGVTFYKTTGNPKITLVIADDTNSKSTEINYLADKTTSLDPGFDIGTFTGQGSSLSVYTHLVNNSEGVNFKKQALPDNNYENMIISVGVSANAGKEITFTAEGLNLPTGIKIFLEDRITNTFTRLDEANSVYTITTTEKLSGIGRFYLHTTNSALNVNENVVLDNVNIYKLDKSTLRIAGLLEQKTTVSIFNILGKQVLNTSFTTNGVKDINLPNFSKGVYLVQVKTNSGNLTKKIILE